MVKSFKTPEKANGWLAYLAEKPIPDTTKKKTVIDSVKLKIDALVKIADSLIRKSLDSVKGKIEKDALINAAQKTVIEIYKNRDALVEKDAEADNASSDKTEEGTELVLKDL